MKKSEILVNETMFATYCPEDNKLRLYVGRVPRPEYDFLRSQGWKATPKQDCDFVATWTPAREDVALVYGQGEIEDEDQDPGSRAADRAERFAGYQGKRLAEAEGHADKYEDGPEVYGYQNPQKAERAAKRRDRQGAKALTQWDKAEYWQSRTAGVIRHALYKDLPGVRMGRIKTLESDLRKHEKSWQEATAKAQAKFDCVLSVKEHAEGTREKIKGTVGLAWSVGFVLRADGQEADANLSTEQLRRAVLSSCLEGYGSSEREKELRREAETGTRPALEIAAEWLEGRERPADWTPESSRWAKHYELRLAYERQMLESQGGTLESSKDIELGGKIGGKLILKTNKSPATGRIVSCSLIGPKVEGYTYKAKNLAGTAFAEYQFNTERLDPSIYTEPTPESLQELADIKAQISSTKKKAASKAPKLLNPTDEEAAKLQAIWNPTKEVFRMTQAEYSAGSKGSYSRFESVEVLEGGKRGHSHSLRSAPYATLCKVRAKYDQVIILTDKPQKKMPAEVWVDPVGGAREWCRGNLQACFDAVNAWRSGKEDRKAECKEAFRVLSRAEWASSPYRQRCDISEELDGLFRDTGMYGRKEATA